MYPLIFFKGLDQVGLFFLFDLYFFLFPLGGDSRYFISCSWRVFFCFFLVPWMLVDIRLVNIYICMYIYQIQSWQNITISTTNYLINLLSTFICYFSFATLLFHSLQIFHIRISRWSFTGVWVITSLLRSPGFFWVFEPILATLLSGWFDFLTDFQSLLQIFGDCLKGINFNWCYLDHFMFHCFFNSKARSKYLPLFLFF